MTLAAADSRSLRALVVDDSRLARATLSRLLTAENLLVDTAESAEEALRYLTEKKPDVVFLDQNMPGMSGLDALRIIKANPATATIPIMMYTSESEGVLLSRARALGAFDVLVKDQVKAVDIRRRLRELRLLPRQLASVTTPPQVETDHPEEMVGAGTDIFTPQQQRALQRLMEEERRKWAGAENAIESETLELNAQGKVPADFQTEPQAMPSEPAPSSPQQWPWVLAVIGIGLMLWSLLSWLLHPQNAVQETGTNETAQTATAPLSEQPVIAKAPEPIEPAVRVDRLLSALEWAVNQQMLFPFDQQPLAGERLTQLQTLLTYLADADFRGEVQLQVFRGDFCLKNGSDGSQQLPAEDSPLSDCRLLSQTEDLGASDVESVEFALFINSSPLANGERGIRVNPSVAFNARPLVNYPPLSDSIQAGEWNAIAERNNRIAVRLLPE